MAASARTPREIDYLGPITAGIVRTQRTHYDLVKTSQNMQATVSILAGN